MEGDMFLGLDWETDVTRLGSHGLAMRREVLMRYQALALWPIGVALVLTMESTLAMSTIVKDARSSGGPSLGGTCGAQHVQEYVGRPFTTVVEELQQESGAEVLRVKRSNHAYTMAHRANRLDVSVDEDEVIRSIQCG